MNVLVLNACGTYLATVSWQRAVCLVVTGSAVVQDADDTRLVRSPSVSVPRPRTVRLVRWTYVKHVETSRRASRAGVLRRDRHTCIYCGRAGHTVDHLLPVSRGGDSTWENLAACCADCNGRKGDRTPGEAGMRLLWQPWTPDPKRRVQRQVWAALDGSEQPALQSA